MADRPRRRRASSTSTGATTDPSQIRWTKESSILRPVSQDIRKSDDWPCYVLSDATIYRTDGKTLANPLLDYVHGLVVVRGFLEEPKKEFAANLIRPSVRSGHIEITRSYLYSIGDGPLALWVSGVAGWFEIKPSAKYQRMYDQVVEAMTLYYSAFEVHEAYIKACRRKGRRPSAPPLDKVFLKYAVRVGDGILRQEVEALCHKWAEFLLVHFLKEKELDWDTSPFAKWLRGLYPEVHKRAKHIAKVIIAPMPPPEAQDSDEIEPPQKARSRSARASSRNSEVESEPRRLLLNRSRSPQPDTQVSNKIEATRKERTSRLVEANSRDNGVENEPRHTFKRSRSPQPELLPKSKAKISESPVPVPEKYRLAMQPASSKPSPAPVPAPQDTPRDTPMSDAEPENPVDRLVAVLREIAAETNLRKAKPSSIHSKVFFKCKIRQYSGAKDILAYYAKDLVPRLPAEWKGTPWYQWLEDAAKQPWKPTEPMDPEKIPPQTLRRTKTAPKAASLNRPATQLPPTINLSKAKKAVQSESEGSENDLAELYSAPQRSRRSGKGATLRLAASSKKRPRSEVDDEAGGTRRGRKSVKTTHQFSDEDEDADDTSDDEAVPDEVIGDEESAVGSRLPLPEGAVRVVVHAEPIPSTSPSGPDGTWTCDQDGCTYVVRSADEEDAQQQIKEHFKVHKAQAEKINLAVKESRGHMPIHHLLDKIQALGRAAFFKEPEKIDGKPVPAPVKRRLLL